MSLLFKIQLSSRGFAHPVFSSFHRHCYSKQPFSYSSNFLTYLILGKLHATYIKVCKKRGLGQVDLTEAHSLCGLLESRGILSMKLGPMSKWASSTKDKKVSLRIDEGEIEAALKDKHLLSGILKDVDCVAK